MANNTLNDIKAYLYITEPDPYLEELDKERILKLEYLNYKCSRQRNNEGLPFGSTLGTLLQFAIYCANDKLDNLYNKLGELNNCSATVVFNPFYGEDGKLKSFTRAFTAKGFIVSLNEIAGFDENILSKRQLEHSYSFTENRTNPYERKSPIIDTVTMQIGFLVNEIKYYNAGSVTERNNNILYINY